MDILMPSLRGHHLSHLWDLQVHRVAPPIVLREPCSGEDEIGVLAANGTTSLVPSCWLTP